MNPIGIPSNSSSPGSRGGSASSSGSRSTPSTSTLRSHVRWLSPTCSSCTRSGPTPKCLANSRWNPIATLHRPSARWPWSSSACVTRPVGFVKSTNHAPGAPISRGQLGQLEHDGHRAQRLREAAGAGRLLPDAVELQRDGLVLVARLVAADAQLHDHEVRALERLALVAGEPQRAAPAGATHHPLREGADDAEALGIDVQQRQFVDRKAVAAGDEPLDQLGRVGAASHRRPPPSHP